MREVQVDRRAVADLLRREVERAWTALGEVAPGETPYGLCVAESAEYGYLSVTPFTEEGLDRVTARYRAGRFGDRYADDDGRELLRWSSADSPYADAGEVGSPPLRTWEDQYELWSRWEEDDAPFETYERVIRAVCFEVLQALDREGLFGDGDRRETVALVLESRRLGALGQDFPSVVAELNPPAVARRLHDHWELVRRLEREGR